MASKERIEIFHESKLPVYSDLLTSRRPSSINHQSSPQLCSVCRHAQMSIASYPSAPPALPAPAPAPVIITPPGSSYPRGSPAHLVEQREFSHCLARSLGAPATPVKVPQAPFLRGRKKMRDELKEARLLFAPNQEGRTGKRPVFEDLYSSLDPLMYTFRSYEDLKDNLDVLHRHCAKIFDINIRKTVYAAGGNMESKFWFGLDSPGYNAQIGNWITNHKKPSGFGGAEVMNKLKFNPTSHIHMNVFNELRKTDRTGKGAIDEEEEPETVTLPTRGVRRTGIRDYHLSLVISETRWLLNVGPLLVTFLNSIVLSINFCVFFKSFEKKKQSSR
ncbi:unnamed protein product [Caenorhabditis brenneri]